MDIFPDRQALANAAAKLLAAALAGPGAGTLVVTGGGTPGPVYDRLSAMDLGWDRITVTLTDDRRVDGRSPFSNARLVRQRLLVGPAAAARFVGLTGGGGAPDDDATAAEAVVRALLPSAATLLGMGEDGHVASLFPGDPDLAARLDPDGDRLCVGVPVAGLEPFIPRVSLTVRALLYTRLVVLLITGAAKRAIIERIDADPAWAPPVAAVLRQTRAQVRILSAD